MKKVSLLLLTIFTATMLVACSDDSGGGAAAPTPIVPIGTPTPPPSGANDGFITWQSEQWNGSVVNATRLSQMLTYAYTHGASQAMCGTDGYYPTGGYLFNIPIQYQPGSGGHRLYFGDYDCESFTQQTFVIFRYNPETEAAQLYVFARGNSGPYVVYSRTSSRLSNQYAGLYGEFGPLFTNGNTPDHISSYQVYVTSSVTSSNVTNLPIEVRFGAGIMGDVVITDNLKRTN